MVRRLFAAALACTLLPATATASQPAPAATAAPASASTPTATRPASASAAPTSVRASTPRNSPAKPATLDWRSRVALAVHELQASDPALLERLATLQPTVQVDGQLSFAAAGLHDRRAAPVLLRRLLAGQDPAPVRSALVDALPLTGGDWQEGAAALVGLDASPIVRKQLISVMRHVDPPHGIHGLRLGFKDEDPEINVAAARAAAFHKHGAELFPELYSATFDTDWDLRAAAVQALGMLKVPRSREILIKALGDEEREVRLQALLALEQLDPEGLLELPQLEKLAKDRKSHRIARKAQLLLQKRRAARKATQRVTAATPSTRATPAPPPAAP